MGKYNGSKNMLTKFGDDRMIFDKIKLGLLKAGQTDKHTEFFVLRFWEVIKHKKKVSARSDKITQRSVWHMSHIKMLKFEVLQ